MATQWRVSGEKQGKNVGVIWSFDLENRVLSVCFAILSVTQAELRVEEAVAESFKLPVYTPVVEYVLPPSVSAMQFVTSGLVNVDRLLSAKQTVTCVFSTVF